MNNITKVNPEQIDNVAKILSKLKLNPRFYQRPFLTIKKDKESLLRMYFFSVAICHQTHTLHSEKVNLWGWDYMEYGFMEMLKNDCPVLQPKYLISTDKNIIKNQLAAYFSDEHSKETTSLDRLDERVDLMIDAANIICDDYNCELSKLFDMTRKYLILNNKGLYDLLEKIKAFSDPKKKKSTFLIKLLTEAGLLKIIDPENIVPIMDYHMQRVLLRTGCVEIIDDEYKNKLISRTTLTKDEPTRSTCIEALKYASKKSGHEITKMNDFFWSLGRSCCNETTLCRDKKCSKVPCTFKTLVLLQDHSECAFQKICPAATDNEYLKLWQPIVKTHFY